MYDNNAVKDLNYSRSYLFVEGTVQFTGTFQFTLYEGAHSILTSTMDIELP